MGAERTLYYWNPYGTELASSHALVEALSAYDRWTVKSIPHVLQTDDYQCGVWSHTALELFVGYFEEGIFCGFASAFVEHETLRPLDRVSRGRTAMVAAEAINTAFIVAVRDEMREALQKADEAGDMPFPAPRAVLYNKAGGKALRRQGKTAEESILL